MGCETLDAPAIGAPSTGPKAKQGLAVPGKEQPFLIQTLPESGHALCLRLREGCQGLGF